MQKTLMLLKPDAIEKGLVVDILERISQKYSITRLKVMQMTRAMASEHYVHIQHLPHFGEIVDFMISDKVIAFVVEGEDVIEGIRKMIGKTFNAEPGTIRGDYGAYSYRTLVHASDSDENARIEIARFFKEWAG